MPGMIQRCEGSGRLTKPLQIVHHPAGTMAVFECPECDREMSKRYAGTNMRPVRVVVPVHGCKA